MLALAARRCLCCWCLKAEQPTCACAGGVPADWQDQRADHEHCGGDQGLVSSGAALAAGRQRVQKLCPLVPSAASCTYMRSLRGQKRSAQRVGATHLQSSFLHLSLLLATCLISNVPSPPRSTAPQDAHLLLLLRVPCPRHAAQPVWLRLLLHRRGGLQLPEAAGRGSVRWLLGCNCWLGHA